MKVLLVVGARPNFMKAAPILRALTEAGIAHALLHTQQHASEEMSEDFLRTLQIDPAVLLRLKPYGDEGILQALARISVGVDKIISAVNPDWIVVVGDVTSTLAATLAAAYRGVKIAHVEAGLRSFDRSMPEEINRIIVDRLSAMLFCSEDSGVVNLYNEGRRKRSVYLVGNVMIDSLAWKLDQGLKPSNLAKGIYARLPSFGLCTLHRPSNVDDREKLSEILDGIGKVAGIVYRVVFPIHPRTVNRLKEFGLKLPGKVWAVPPLSYDDMLYLTKNARLVLTDSGGIQEETTFLGIPCVTIRENTERPATIKRGTNRLAGTTREGIVRAAESALVLPQNRLCPPLWDGKTAVRIVDILTKEGKA